MEADQVGFLKQGKMQRCDVAVTDKYFGVGAEQVVIEQRQQSRNAIPAADTEDGLYLGVGKHSHEISGAFSIRAGEESMPVPHVASQLHFEAKLLNDARPIIDRSWVGGRAGRRHQTDGVARVQPFRFRSEEHTSELQSLRHLVCRLLLEKKKKKNKII